MDDVYLTLEFDKIVSKADFYALGAIVAVELGIENGDQTQCPMPCFNLKW